MTSTKGFSTKAELSNDRISNRKLHAFLQDDALTECITSELEQLNYAQILTSLATGATHNKNVSNSLPSQPENDALKASQGSQDSVKTSTAHTTKTNGKNEFSRRQKRRVIPSRKIREKLRESNDVSHHSSYCNAFRRENGMKSNRKRENKGKTCPAKRDVLLSDCRELCPTKDRKKPVSSVGKFLRKNKKCALGNDGIASIHNGRKKTYRKERKFKESLGESEGTGSTCRENGNDSQGNKNEENYTEVKLAKSKESTNNEGNKTTIDEESRAEVTEVKTRNSKEYNEDGGSDEKTRYRCEQCGKRFKTYYTFSIHVRMPEHTKETPFVCDVCGKGFRLSSTLCRHKIIHTSDKPHGCKLCRKTFNRSSTLKMHMRTHSARKQHVCGTCGKGFHQKGNLRNHMFVHSGERPFCCETCGRHFNKKSNLKHHLKIHEMNGKFSCTVCKKVFEDHTGLKEHMQTKHILL